MNKKNLIKRIIASPFIFWILLVEYLFWFAKHFIMFIKYGGEWITYCKDEHKQINDIYELLKK